MSLALCIDVITQSAKDATLRIAGSSKKLLVPIVLIGLLAPALIIACPGAVHLPLLGSVADECAVMAHSGLAAAVVDQQDAPDIALEIIVTALAVNLGLSGARRRETVAVFTSGVIPPDPRFGRLRI